MKYVFVKGVHFGNKGAELMFLAIKQELDGMRDDIRLVLAPGAQSTFERRMEHQAYQLFNLAKGKHDFNGIGRFVPARVRTFLRQRFGIVFEVDLSAILDASGFAYGDNWPLENSSRAYRQAARLRSGGGKYIFMPQAFGPFARQQERDSMKAALDASHAAYARDQISHDYLAQMGIDLPIVEDFTSVVKPATDGARCGLLIVPNSNMLRGKKGWTREFYLDTVVRIARSFHAATGEPVSVMNHEGPSDQQVSEELHALIDTQIGTGALIVPCDALEAKRAIAGSRLVFASRYHACISALASGVVCLGTSWSHKYEELYKGYGVEALLIDAEAGHAVEQTVHDTLNDAERIEAALKAKAAENIARSRALLRECLSAI